MMRLKIGHCDARAAVSRANRVSDATAFDAIPSVFQGDEVEGFSKIESLRTKREHGRRSSGVEAVAAPATVSGEPLSGIDHWETGKVRNEAKTREPGDLPSAVSELMSERGRLGVAGPVNPETPKAVTRDRGQSASEGSMHIMGDLILAAHRAVGRQITRAFLVATALAVFGLPSVAKADCEVADNGVPEDSFLSVLGPNWETLGGLRPALARAGIGVSAGYYAEPFANSGGIKQGGKYNGVLEVAIDADMKKLGFWKGLCFHTNGYQIHGQSITGDNIGALMPVTSLEALPATRLFELWLEQHMFNDKLSVKVGQLAADEEFILSEGGGFFINGTWGWPSITAADLPGGGPAYPLATPGVRVAITPNDATALLIGVYNGNPAGDCDGDPQVCNKNGLDFNLDEPPLLMIEGAYTYNPDGLRGIIKIGGWNHFDTFEDQFVDIGGNLIAETGQPGRPIDNNWGLYGIVDQLIWRVPGSEDPTGVGVFARFIGAPQDQNLIDFYFDGGITFSGMFRRRPDDAIAFGIAYTGISDRVSAFDVSAGEPVARNYEMLLEICYTMQVAPGWTIQPDFQYIWQPGGNVPDEDGSGAVADAAVFGLRSAVAF
jgi:porin